MPKAVLFEENLCRNGRTPTDYKFYIANGHCFILYIDVDRNSGLKETHYDRNWVALPFTSDGFPLAENVEPPDNLAEMMELAEELAAPFEFARVDMYSVDDRILFGEITHFPASGKSLYVPRSAGVDMLSMLKEALRSPRKAPRDGVAAGAN